MPTYPDLKTFKYQFTPEKFIRELWEPLGIESVLDCGAGTNGVFDYGYLTGRPDIKIREANDIYWLRPMSSAWGLRCGVDVQELSTHYDHKSFDMVQCMEVLEHVADPKRALIEMCKVARKIVIITSDDELVHSQDPDSCQKQTERKNKHQAYIKQPSVDDMLELGFEVRVEENGRRQLIAWKIFDTTQPTPT